MAEYNLLDTQKELVRKLVQVYEETGVATFDYAVNSVFTGATFRTKPPKTMRMMPEDLQAIADEGLIAIGNPTGNRSSVGNSVKKSAVDAVANDFKKPDPNTSIGSVSQTFHGPVAAVNIGGNIRVVHQTVGMGPEELSAFFSGLRKFVNSLPPQQSGEAKDALDGLETEMKSPERKQSRLKAFLQVLGKSAADSVEWATKIAALAQALGIHI